MHEKKTKKSKHLSLEDRLLNEHYLKNQISSFSYIGKALGKAKRFCPKLDKAPYVCNGCSSYHFCHLQRMIYNGTIAYNEYVKELKSSRSHLRISKQEIAIINEIVSPFK